MLSVSVARLRDCLEVRSNCHKLKHISQFVLTLLAPSAEQPSKERDAHSRTVRLAFDSSFSFLDLIPIHFTVFSSDHATCCRYHRSRSSSTRLASFSVASNADRTLHFLRSPTPRTDSSSPSSPHGLAKRSPSPAPPVFKTGSTPSKLPLPQLAANSSRRSHRSTSTPLSARRLSRGRPGRSSKGRGGRSRRGIMRSRSRRR